MSLKSIVDRLGGDLYDRGRRANIPAPGHSRADRSVSLILSAGRVVVHAFSGADWRDVLDDLRRQGLVDAANAPRSVSSAAPDLASAQPGPLERVATANRIWSGGKPVSHTLSERYLRLRRIDRELPGEDVLRHHPETPISAYADRSRTMAALVAAVTNAEGALTAVELTYLDPNGRRSIGLRLSRKTIGLVPPSSAIQLDSAGPEMVVAEGVLTTLSASERFGLPGWALMSTRNLRGWSAPAGVRSVLIAGDRGADGERSAGVLAARLRGQGVRSRIVLPPAEYGDWNEAAAAM